MREKKVQRSRERITSEAIALFARNGYEQTTMEAIAEAADVSPRTLYRYFPSKDLIVLASFTANTAKFSEVFALRVKEMPIERALAEAIFAVLAVEDEEPKHALLVRSIIGQSPVTRARLWDYLGEQQRSLTKQLSECLGVEVNDPAVILTARIALEVLLAAADIWRASKGRASSRGTAENLMLLLRNGGILFPNPGTSALSKPSGSNQPVKKLPQRRRHASM
ncbi:TetR/AcrR family transcriptional regulator [Silvibacterium bohemicum]|nr:TetR/AcrR family transcriptional regulator [Silvibacterium bohemicum]